MALDAETRQVVATVAGDRSEATARCLRDDLPEEYRDRAMMCTDFWSAHVGAVPAERRVAAGKEEGLTNHVERFRCALRQRCARVMRKTPSFSKCFPNRIGALRYFIRHYNGSLL